MKINEDMKKIIAKELAYVATVDGDSNPNIGPKRTMRYLDENHLIFCENTGGKHFNNIKENGKIAVAFADRENNHGYRFVGKATSYTDEEHMNLAKETVGVAPKKACVIIEIEKIYTLDSGPIAGKLYKED